ncbi:lipid-A-disaccharide synthase [Ferrovibrio xuzhouensis]|uniref:Lipid-A-disaccharide synthase n=1 Tax=Ferrovibrio xuzhouensis TaxID=1576914 RepID=A0ABV7VJ94_9PROT
MAEARPLRVALIAGEPSGDALGASLMRALRRETDDAVVFSGIGGAQMIGQGMQSRFPIVDLAVMGLVEVLPRIRLLRRRIDETARFLLADPPDIAVTIDSPGFTRRVAQKLAGRSFPLVHYVAPTVWAWRPGRARRLARLYDHLLAILPFEPPYFEVVGLPTTYVGHPAVETIAAIRRTEAAAVEDGRGFRVRHDIPADRQILAVLPGSRQGEVRRLLPVFDAVLRLLKGAGLNLHLVIPTVETVAETVHSAAADLPFPALVVEQSAERYAAMLTADAALAASGTATLELGLAGVPTVLAYRVNALTAAIVRRLLRTPYAGLVNILSGREVMPEFLQENCRAERIAPALLPLLTDAAARRAQTDVCAAITLQLGGGEDLPPSVRAARAVLAAAARRLPAPAKG